jgi:hypothetical protein
MISMFTKRIFYALQAKQQETLQKINNWQLNKQFLKENDILNMR